MTIESNANLPPLTGKAPNTAPTKITQPHGDWNRLNMPQANGGAGGELKPSDVNKRLP